MQRWACFCADIPSLPTRTRVVVVRHRTEVHRSSNTGWLVGRALQNASVHDFGLLGHPLDLREHVGPHAWVLGPGAPVPAVRTDAPAGRVANEHGPVMVVLDGSWAQVRTMRARIPPLPSLATLTLSGPDAATPRMRRPLQEGYLATIEAVAAALEWFGDERAGHELRTVFAIQVARMRQMRGRAGRAWSVG